MPAEQRNLVRQLAALVERYHGEGAAARRIPIDRQILRVDLNDGGRQHSHFPFPPSPPTNCHVYPHRRGFARAQIVARERKRTLTRFVSQALRLMWRLS